ncbi:hypothetical protein BLNAU_16354 [Blattamonas nauphoetae]|uniref:Uncharacterized protein n=1 Tax=Blattamonas nauphoetae TaxID=2049346 RepID=A0ABQ9XEJ3_9EUKA|nr:hypothetical protein BLNAU_16354 [Blattamonas nauphoetae]
MTKDSGADVGLLSFVLQFVRVSLTPSHCHRVVGGNELKKHEEGVHDSLPSPRLQTKLECFQNTIFRSFVDTLLPLSSSFASDGVVFGTNCSPFLNWDEKQPESVHEKAIVFRSLVATLKFHPALDASLEAKAVKLLKSVDQKDSDYADGFLISLGGTPDESLTNFVSSILVLISSSNRVITTAMVKILKTLIIWCSTKVRLALVSADLIPQLISTLNPLSLSFAEAVYIHTDLMDIIRTSLKLSTPGGLRQLKIYEEDEQQAVHETVLKQVVAPSEKYISHMCMNRFSIVRSDQSRHFLELLAQLLKTCPYHQATMDFVIKTPVVLTIPSYLTFFEDEFSIFSFLDNMNNAQREWNMKGRVSRQMGKTVLRMLRMEGIEDMLEEKLRNDRNGHSGSYTVSYSKEWSYSLGMNLPKQE